MSRHGYPLEAPAVLRSPISMREFEEMKQSVLFADEDVQFLNLSGEVVADQLEAILDVWYDFIGSTPHLVASFASRTHGKPLVDYLERVRKRFARWILDTSQAKYDQEWLDYQYEIGLRHHRSRKNRTDEVDSTDIVPFRHLFAVVFPVTLTLKPFLASKGHSRDEVDKMYNAWLKSCLLQLTLWSYPYVKSGDF